MGNLAPRIYPITFYIIGAPFWTVTRDYSSITTYVQWDCATFR